MTHHVVVSLELARHGSASQVAQAVAEHPELWGLHVIDLGERRLLILAKGSKPEMDELREGPLAEILEDLDDQFSEHPDVELGLEVLVATGDQTKVVATFTQAARASGEVWGLHGVTWARSMAAGEREALPFWPSKTAARQHAVGSWAGLSPKVVEVSVLLEEWLPAMEEDGIAVVLEAVDPERGVVVEPGVLAEALSGADD